MFTKLKFFLNISYQKNSTLHENVPIKRFLCGRKKEEKFMFNPANEISSINFGSIIGGALNAVVNAQKESAETTVSFVKRVGFMPGRIDPKTGKEVGVGEPVNVSFAYDKEVSPAHVSTSKEYQVEVTDGGSGYTDASAVKITIGGEEVSAAVTLDGDKIESVTLNANLPDDTKDDAEVKAESTVGSGAALKLKVIEAGRTVPAMYQKMKIDVPILTMMPIPFIRIDYTDIEFNVKINSVANTSSSDNSNTSVKSDTTAGYKGWGFNASTTLNASFSNQKASSSSEEVKKDYSLNIKVHAVQDDMPAGMAKILDILEENISMKAISGPAAKNDKPAGGGGDGN